MSAGVFSRSRYSSDSGSIHPIRVQPETLDLTIGGVANAAPAGAVTAGVPSAKVSGSSRSIGLSARLVRIQFTATPPTGYKAGGTITLPWLLASTFGAISPNAVGTYLGVAIIVLGKRGEVLK
jgi:hypothetical protein